MKITNGPFDFVLSLGASKPSLCLKSLETKVRQGENRRGTVGVALDFTGVNEHSEPVFNAA
ncbi:MULTISPECIES: hypothetical protein [Pseudomonas]|uniref:hypothetical protein n=1 Tax=Pseudomonas brassicacearum TaxID=930166 RepID=UPI0011CD4446|nr:hypothetical protein [Pseudomonas brassicacearum]